MKRIFYFVIVIAVLLSVFSFRPSSVKADIDESHYAWSENFWGKKKINRKIKVTYDGSKKNAKKLYFISTMDTNEESNFTNDSLHMVVSDGKNFDFHIPNGRSMTGMASVDISEIKSNSFVVYIRNTYFDQIYAYSIKLSGKSSNYSATLVSVTKMDSVNNVAAYDRNYLDNFTVNDNDFYVEGDRGVCVRLISKVEYDIDKDRTVETVYLTEGKTVNEYTGAKSFIITVFNGDILEYRNSYCLPFTVTKLEAQDNGLFLKSMDRYGNEYSNELSVLNKIVGFKGNNKGYYRFMCGGIDGNLEKPNGIGANGEQLKSITSGEIRNVRYITFNFKDNDTLSVSCSDKSGDRKPGQSFELMSYETGQEHYFYIFREQNDHLKRYAVRIVPEKYGYRAYLLGVSDVEYGTYEYYRYFAVAADRPDKYKVLMYKDEVSTYPVKLAYETYDIDHDGNKEEVFVMNGPTSGMFTAKYVVFENRELEYSNCYYQPYVCDIYLDKGILTEAVYEKPEEKITVSVEDGKIVLKSTNSEYTFDECNF